MKIQTGASRGPAIGSGSPRNGQSKSSVFQKVRRDSGSNDGDSGDGHVDLVSEMMKLGLDMSGFTTADVERLRGICSGVGGGGGGDGGGDVGGDGGGGSGGDMAMARVARPPPPRTSDTAAGVHPSPTPRLPDTLFYTPALEAQSKLSSLGRGQRHHELLRVSSKHLPQPRSLHEVGFSLKEGSVWQGSVGATEAAWLGGDAAQNGSTVIPRPNIDDEGLPDELGSGLVCVDGRLVGPDGAVLERRRGLTDVELRQGRSASVGVLTGKGLDFGAAYAAEQLKLYPQLREVSVGGARLASPLSSADRRVLPGRSHVSDNSSQQFAYVDEQNRGRSRAGGIPWSAEASKALSVWVGRLVSGGQAE